MIVGIMYRPPNASTLKFSELLTEKVNSIMERFNANADIFILGDFNINYLNKRTEAMKHLRHFEVSTGLNQLICKETRYDSCLDLIYSNSDIISNSGVLDVSLSDHNVIFVSRKKGKEPFKTITFTGRSYVDYDKAVFQQALVEQDWTCFYS